MKPAPTWLESAYLGLFLVGTILPLLPVMPWLTANGLNLPLFLSEAFANRVSSAFALDVVVSVVAVLVFVFVDEHYRTPQRVLIGLCTILIGVSCGLGLALWLRA